MKDLRKVLKAKSSEERAKVSRWFFKTGPGQYGEGDIFIGVSVPDVRAVAKAYPDTTLREISALLKSPVHEERLLAVILLVKKYSKGDEKQKDQILKFYLRNKKGVNNWDLVDTSAHYILGSYCLNSGSTGLMDKLLLSKRHWDRRIAVLATFPFIREGQTNIIFKYASTLLEDQEDLMHKAVGWMLREAGKRNEAGLKGFIKKFGKRMPRTMLRYSIEKFSPDRRKKILSETLS